MATFYSAFIISIKNLNVGDGVIKVTLVMKVLNIKVLEHGRSKAHR